MSELKLEIGKYYRAKKPRRTDDGGYNDRYVLWISRDGQTIQYDGPTVAIGRHRPTVPIEKFKLWAGSEITKEDYMNTKPVNKVELLEKMGKLPPNDLGLSEGQHYCPFCGMKLSFYQHHKCIKENEEK